MSYRLSRMKWCYSYGRKGCREKLQNGEIPATTIREDGVVLEPDTVQRHPKSIRTSHWGDCAGAERIIHAVRSPT